MHRYIYPYIQTDKKIHIDTYAQRNTLTNIRTYETIDGEGKVLCL